MESIPGPHKSLKFRALKGEEGYVLTCIHIYVHEYTLGYIYTFCKQNRCSIFLVSSSGNAWVVCCGGEIYHI
jgi:hypothetical protein